MPQVRNPSSIERFDPRNALVAKGWQSQLEADHASRLLAQGDMASSRPALQHAPEHHGGAQDAAAAQETLNAMQRTAVMPTAASATHAARMTINVVFLWGMAWT